jgi:serine/threonine-protein kinase
MKCEGTIGYMSPEQARGLETDHRSDIYSLGVTLYQMVTGRLPYAGANALEVMVQHVEAPIPLAHEAVGAIPPVLSDLMRHMMAKNPDNRFQDYPPSCNSSTIPRLR